MCDNIKIAHATNPFNWKLKSYQQKRMRTIHSFYPKHRIELNQRSIRYAIIISNYLLRFRIYDCMHWDIYWCLTISFVSNLYYVFVRMIQRKKNHFYFIKVNHMLIVSLEMENTKENAKKIEKKNFWFIPMKLFTFSFFVFPRAVWLMKRKAFFISSESERKRKRFHVSSLELFSHPIYR